MKERLDVLLVKQGLAVSREKAKAVIMAGCVYVDNQKEDKAGSMFPDTAKIEVRGNTLKYVSRGGLKLEKAMDHLMTPGTFMDPSFVAYNYYLADSKEFPLLIDDGRHRLAAAAKLGLRKVPIWVMKEQIEDIAKVIRVYKN